MAVVGNKSDLESQRQIQTAVAQEYAENMHASFIEASAKEDINVSTIFIDISMGSMKIILIVLGKRLPRNISATPQKLQLVAPSPDDKQPASRRCC